MSSTGDSYPSDEDSIMKASPHVRTVFVCGFIHKRWHNGALQTVIQDLVPDYFVCCNRETWDSSSNTRALLVNAEAFIFFVNEFTLGDPNCLITLQYAWHLMIPIIMLRPPRTKLVICARERRNDLVVPSNGSIVKSPVHGKPVVNHYTPDDIDYSLLQDILYEGYRISIIYDRLDHKKSMTKISARLEKIIPPLHPHTMQNTQNTIPRNRSKTNMSRASSSGRDSNGLNTLAQSRNSSRTRLTAEVTKADATNTRNSGESMRHCKSTGNLNTIANGNGRSREERKKDKRAPTLKQQNRQLTEGKPLKVGKVRADDDTDRSDQTSQVTMSRGPPSIVSSFSMSFDRRCSMSSLDDFTNYQSTQYLVFPVQDRTKKPTLIKFPEDLVEEQFKDGSVWGSDTSLEEEAEIAPHIRGELELDIDREESPISSPAPYMESLA